MSSVIIKYTITFLVNDLLKRLPNPIANSIMETMSVNCKTAFPIKYDAKVDKIYSATIPLIPVANKAIFNANDFCFFVLFKANKNYFPNPPERERVLEPFEYLDVLRPNLSQRELFVFRLL